MLHRRAVSRVPGPALRHPPVRGRIADGERVGSVTVTEPVSAPCRPVSGAACGRCRWCARPFTVAPGPGRPGSTAAGAAGSATTRRAGRRRTSAWATQRLVVARADLDALHDRLYELEAGDRGRGARPRGGGHPGRRRLPRGARLGAAGGTTADDAPVRRVGPLTMVGEDRPPGRSSASVRPLLPSWALANSTSRGVGVRKVERGAGVRGRGNCGRRRAGGRGRRAVAHRPPRAASG